MQRITSVVIYDALDRVHVTSQVREFPGTPDERSSIVYECTTTFPGTGEPDPRQWLIDACVALIESI